jgi:hypothetical protein
MCAFHQGTEAQYFDSGFRYALEVLCGELDDVSIAQSVEPALIDDDGVSS